MRTSPPRSDWLYSGLGELVSGPVSRYKEGEGDSPSVLRPWSKIQAKKGMVVK